MCHKNRSGKTIAMIILPLRITFAVAPVLHQVTVIMVLRSCPRSQHPADKKSPFDDTQTGFIRLWFTPFQAKTI